jgi:hypothetical protein
MVSGFNHIAAEVVPTFRYTADSGALKNAKYAETLDQHQHTTE